MYKFISKSGRGTRLIMGTFVFRLVISWFFGNRKLFHVALKPKKFTSIVVN